LKLAIGITTLVIILSIFQALPDEVNVPFIGFDAPLGFFLKAVQHVNRLLEFNRIASAISVAFLIFYKLRDRSACKTFERLGLRRGFSVCTKERANPTFCLTFGGKSCKSFLADATQ